MIDQAAAEGWGVFGKLPGPVLLRLTLHVHHLVGPQVETARYVKVKMAAI